MQADPWWSFAMAFNVFLVFFNNANPSKFQEYKWIYCVVCFGGPLLPAIVLVSIRDEERGPVFGDAAVSIPDIPARWKAILTGAQAVVLDPAQMEHCSSICVLHSHLDVYPPLYFDLHCCGIPCFS